MPRAFYGRVIDVDAGIRRRFRKIFRRHDAVAARYRGRCSVSIKTGSTKYGRSADLRKEIPLGFPLKWENRCCIICISLRWGDNSLRPISLRRRDVFPSLPLPLVAPSPGTKRTMTKKVSGSWIGSESWAVWKLEGVRMCLLFWRASKINGKLEKHPLNFSKIFLILEDNTLISEDFPWHFRGFQTRRIFSKFQINPLKFRGFCSECTEIGSR